MFHSINMIALIQLSQHAKMKNENSFLSVLLGMPVQIKMEKYLTPFKIILHKMEIFRKKYF